MRASQVLVGLLAGGLTTWTALSHPAGDGGAPPMTAAAVVAPRASVTASAGTVAVAPRSIGPVGSLRVHEAAVAQAEYQRTAPAAAARSTTTPGAFVRPTAGARTGWFGERRRSHLHPGIDYDGETGDAVVASGSGTVAYAGTAPSGYSGYGQMVLIEHGDGIVTLYAHLSRLAVKPGMPVAAGDLVGAIGTTGSVTGSHLHFELRLGGRPVDPAGWIAGAR